MTVLLATISAYSLGGHDNLDYLATLDGYDPDTYLLYGEALSVPSLTDAYTFAPPVLATTGLLATVTPTYQQDYYDRIHITPNPLQMGNLLSEQIRQVYVWNAYTSSQLLSAFAELNTDGIEVL
ncbi:MAG: hypothetical protein PF495_19210, partial [Spirochaetales bacterium]|nr:hypothetical protein [Spirochaetales bacterium]